MTIGVQTGATNDATFYRYAKSDGLIINKDSGTTTGNPQLQVDVGSTLNLYGATISCRSFIQLNGTFRARSANFNRPTGGTAWRCNVASTATLDIDGLYTPSIRWAFAPGANVTSKNFRAWDILQWEANGGPHSTFYPVRDHPYIGLPAGATGALEFNNRSGICWQVTNSEKGDGINVAGQSGALGVTEVGQEVTIKFRTPAGGAVDSPIWFSRGFNNGQRKDYDSATRPSDTQYLTQGDDVVVVQGDANGDCPTTRLLNFVMVNKVGSSDYSTSNVAPNLYDIRCDGGFRGSNVRTVYSKRYGSLPQTLKAAMLGLGGTAMAPLDSADSKITISRAAAQALTAATTYAEAYALGILWSATPAIANLEYPSSTTYVWGYSGNVLISNVATLVVDASAGAAWATNIGTNTITVKASSLAADATFTQLSAQNLTLANGAKVGAITVSGVLSGGLLSDYLGRVDLTGTARWECAGPGTAPAGSAAAGTTVRVTSATNGAVLDFRAFSFAAGSIVENTSGQPITLRLLSTQIVPTLLATAGAIALDQADKTASITGLVAGSCVTVWNATTSTQILASIVAGTSWSLAYKDGAGQFTTGDTVQVYVSKYGGTTAKTPQLYTTAAGATGWSILAAQVDDSPYNTNAIDGATITDVAFNLSSIDLDLNATDAKVPWKELYAAFIYQQALPAGQRLFYGMMTAQDSANFLFNAAIVFNNLNATPVLVGGDGYGQRADGGNLFGTGSIKIDNIGKAFVAGISNMAAAVWSSPTRELTSAAPPTASQVADAIGTRAPVAGWPYDRMIRVAAALAASKTSGMSTGQAGTSVVRDLDDSRDLITATQDANGNRTAVSVAP